MKKLTRRQSEIVSFIRDFIAENKMSPTIYEIAGHFSIQASSVCAHLLALQKKNILTRQSQTRRSIRLVNPSSSKTPPASMQIPFYDSLSDLKSAADSRFNVDRRSLPRGARVDDLFAFRAGAISTAFDDIQATDLFVVWTEPLIVRDGAMLLLRSSGAYELVRACRGKIVQGEIIGRVVSITHIF